MFTDPEGGRHAVRISEVIVASDADQCQDATMLQLPGNRAVMVRMPLDAVLDLFGVDGGQNPRLNGADRLLRLSSESMAASS